MKTRHKKIHVIEDEDDSNSENYSNKRRKKKEDLDEDYNINNYEDDLYSNKDDEEEEDVSYYIRKESKRKYSNIKSTSKKEKSKLTTKKKEKKNILRKSFKNSLGRNKKMVEDNKENVNITNINSNTIEQHLKNNKNKKPPLSSMKKPKKNEILKKIKEEEKQKIESQLDKTYFYQNLTPLQWKEISNFISSSLINKNLKEEDLACFFSEYPNLLKGKQNVIKLRQILKDLTKNNGFLSFCLKNDFEFESYEKINDFIINNYFMVKPTIFEVHFFPNSSEEIHLINLISKTRTSLDIAMFTINNVRIAEEIKNIFNKGIKLRIITDSECIKMSSSNVYSLAAIGVNIKIDDSSRYHMHHKFCVIDNSVVITGSFNWTDQAVNHNQENLLFLEDQNLAMQYSNEFQKLWDDFEIVVTKEKALLKIKEDEEKKRAAESRKKREKEKKLMEKENIKKEKEKEKENETTFEETENNYSNKHFTNKKRYRNKNEIEPSIQSNDHDHNNCDNNQCNGHNTANSQQNGSSSCLIF